jgi:AcrR family transcriptional regulator
VAHICAAARIGRGTLYQYFDNKRDVMIALLQDVAARVERVLAARPPLGPIVEQFAAARPPAKVIAAFTGRRMREVLDAIFIDEATLRLILRDARGLDGAFEKVLSRIDAVLLEAITRDLALAQKAGIMRPGHTKHVARYLLGGMEKMILSALADDAPLDVDALVRLVVELELYGLLTEEVRR